MSRWPPFIFLFCILGVFVPHFGTAQEQSYNLLLLNIFTSHGVLVPEFKQERLSYTVKLSHALEQFAITPVIDRSRPEYQGGETNLPIIQISSNDGSNNPSVSASTAVRRQMDLPDNGNPLTVLIKVVNPHNSGDTVQYSITVNQSAEPLVTLKSVEAVDDLGNPVVIEPMASQDDATYNVYVNPDAESSTLMELVVMINHFLNHLPAHTSMSITC